MSYAILIIGLLVPLAMLVAAVIADQAALRGGAK